MISQTAQGLASLGRNGDSMLVHMSPEEIGGLKQVGDSLGIKMSTNPHTGMPEAFSFGDFFTSFLPTIAGIAAAPATGGFSMAPLLAGAGTGALLAVAKGEDPLMGGITGGFGGYGGGNLAGSFGKMAAQGTSAGAMNTLKDAAYSGSLGGMQAGAGGATQAGATSFGAGLTPEVSRAIANPMAVNAAAPSFGQNMLSQAGTNLGNTYSGLGELVKDPSAAYGRFTEAGGTASQLAMPVGGAVLAGLEPSDLGYGAGNLYEDPDKGKYRGPQGQLNLSDKYSSGLRLVAEGGYIDGYATGGTIQSGGIRDLYGTPDNQPTISPGLSGFGLGRLNNLAGEQAMTQAQTLGYADGGGVVAGERGMNMNELPTLNVNTGEQSYGGGLGGVSDSFEGKTGLIYDMARLKDKAKPGSISYGYLSHLNNILQGKPSSFSTHASGVPYMAKGGYLDGQGDGMSDSIPATIEGKQPARLADGEFVVPADVVSHLGNGSSKAGSKRLYAMLDKVRHARTGNKKQGKEINPAKYMPA
jgi:hypothetical protein